MRQMLAVSLDDKDLHTRLIVTLQANAKVGHYLWQTIQAGRVATNEIQLRGRRID